MPSPLQASQPATCPPHDWQNTGRVDRSLKGVPWRWFKCAACGQDGFMRGLSPVIYTWQAEDAEAV